MVSLIKTMKALNTFFVGLVLAATTRLTAQVVPINITIDGQVLMAAKTNGADVSFVATNWSHAYKINHLTIEMQTDASPVDYIFSGDLIVSDSGTPPKATPLPIFLGSNLHPPILVAITDAHGKFCFRVWLKQDSRDSGLQVSSITNADIYIGWANVHAASIRHIQQFEGDLKLKSGPVRKYSLAQLLTDSEKTKLSP